MTHSREAFWWSLFSAGGVLAALFLPAIILVTGLSLPFFSGQDVVAVYGGVHDNLSMWWVRGVVFVVVFLSLFHCFHRIRHILMDLGLRHASTTLSLCCYGIAGVGTVLIAVFMIRL